MRGKLKSRAESKLVKCGARKVPRAASKLRRQAAGPVKKPVKLRKNKAARQLPECDQLSVLEDARATASACLRWVLDPIETDVFFDQYWERKPLLVSRPTQSKYSRVFSTAEFDRILREEMIVYSKNLDVTSYGSSGRETHNPDGRAHSAVVWDYFRNGCSLRLLNPQTYCAATWRICSVLQEYFGCMVGANVYLTPAGTQGFAPHYDDIEAFLLQLEGAKEWRVYPPSESETLPRSSSANLSAEELPEPYLSTVLRAGDLLYMPRGWVHQGRAVRDQHSLHITISCYQHSCWADLLEKLVPVALQRAVEDNVDYRRGLPVGYLNYMGLIHEDAESTAHTARSKFLREARRLVSKLVDYMPVDGAADQLAKHFLSEALPPSLSADEISRTVRGDGERWQGDRVQGRAEIDLSTQVKLVRPNAVRLVNEGGQLLLFHSLDNGRVYNGESTEAPVELDQVWQAEAFAQLVRTYPHYVTVGSLMPDISADEQVAFVSSLWEQGLLLTKSSLLVA